MTSYGPNNSAARLTDWEMGNMWGQGAVFTCTHSNTGLVIQDSCKNRKSGLDKSSKRQRTRRAASGEEKGKRTRVKEREARPIWNLHWGAASSISGESLSVSSMGGECGGGVGEVGGRQSRGDCRAGERRGLGGAGWSVAPRGWTTCRQGRHR